ncbi:hypothetical protein [Alistipes sp.]|uniref:hypothetical protein n=1 Tax=Alistipes sp. TaxID=1872444 RepID=UPI0025BDFDCB|nr:hypothetical protein [Alistipes sp.]
MAVSFKYLLWGLLLVPFFAVACSEDEAGEDAAGYVMSVSVSSRSNGVPSDLEQRIYSVYVYAYDDSYISSPDTYFEPRINGGNGVLNIHGIRMKIRREGSKRFYVFVNPPRYIESELKHKVSEEFLKSLSLYMYTPVFRVEDFPQDIGGMPSTNGSGRFPMSNVFAAHVRSIDDSRTVYLFPDEQLDAAVIRNIPLFRSFGKISVEAYLKGYAEGNGVSVNRLEIYNYGGEGYALPFWDETKPYWQVDGATSVWNPGMVMDLRKMAERETKVQTTPVPLLSAPVALTQPAGGEAVVSPVTKFYLSQNSYGKPASDGDTQSGLVDEVGNRESRMVVYLSDSRVSEMVLPFLRRNDNLTVRLAISEFGLNVNFKVWNTSNVNPDWSEEILPPVNEG